ncbi:threonine--tRNA ligase [archaeon]|jgi:threonyl-tRNA synthetase|nr:threonine--tRNA ligase [archaeon]MBT3577961.1 threonine--tRNA ligase [archaeon]MBT6820564.1 threonine--tRNA ligase [archaeon]MBT6955933.1 threonine--tRNA ligase [archaeon]MBT7025815.1 threonine--tRNA ligase [archaeon]
MKTLNLHCDYINFKALKKALKSVDEIAPNQTLEGDSKDCLVVMVAVEKGDSKATVQGLVESIQKIATDVKAKNIVLYPYAHLSSNLGKPETAVEVLNETAKKLKGFKVLQAPFGYYKQFELKVKGHPLSELSREIKVEGNEIEEEELTDEQRAKLLRQISKSKLDTSKIKENDHRIIGGKMDLWSFNSSAPGMVFWHSKGLHIKNKLIEYWRELHRKNRYSEISTPQILDKKLWEISGHWSKFKENMFLSSYENRDLAIKPMNCPGGMLVYKTSPKSYKDLPLRVGELGWVHRIELSGVLGGLMRVIQFVQDDAHIFCTEKSLEEEIAKIIDLTNDLYKTFKIEIDHVELSTRPKKRIGSEKIWDLAEKALEKVLKKKKMKYTVNKGDGAFYGPKIDFHIKDSLGRTWQTSTIQLDMALPERFELEYTSEDGSAKRPIMLHRTIYGSLERFLGVYTEHVDGKFPLWISPNQIKVMTLNDDVKDYANEIYQKLFDEGFEVEINDKSESMGKKARDAQIQRFNYLVTVGEKEKAAGNIAVKARDSKEIVTMDLDGFISQLKEEISTKA